jgi:hypothetical protein
MSYIIKRRGGDGEVASLNQGLVEVVLEDDNMNTRRFNTLEMAKDYLRKFHVTKFKNVVEFVEVVNMPEGFLSRIEWTSDGPSLSNGDREYCGWSIKRAMIADAVEYRSLYDDCGEVNHTKLAENFAIDHELNIYRKDHDPECLWDLFDIAIAIEKDVIKAWENKDNEDGDQEDIDD